MQQTTSLSDDEITSRLQQYFSTGSPLFAYLGLTIEAASSTGIDARFTPRPELAGASAEASPFGGAITTVLDTLFGLAIMINLGAPMPIATINLRTDFIEPSSPSSQVSGELKFSARCISIDKDIARAEGTCIEPVTEAIIAHSYAAFAIGTRGPILAPEEYGDVAGDG